MRFELELPWGLVVAYGLDVAVGVEWFGELIDDERERVVSSYDLLSRNYNRAQPIRGLLLWIGLASEQYDRADLDRCLAVVLADKPHWDGPQCFDFVYSLMENLSSAARYHCVCPMAAFR